MGSFGDEQIRQLNDALSRLRRQIVDDVAAVVRQELEHVGKAGIMDSRTWFPELDSINHSERSPALPRPCPPAVQPASLHRLTPDELVIGPEFLKAISEEMCLSHSAADPSSAQQLEAAESDLGEVDAGLVHEECEKRFSWSHSTSMNARTLEEIETWTKKEQEHQAKRAAIQTLDNVVAESACRLLAARVVEAPSFDLGLCLVILTNSIVIGVEVQMFASAPAETLPPQIGIIDSVIFVAFLIELILRVVARGFRHFFWSGPNVGWNWFDAFVVATSIFDLLGSMLMSAGSSAVDMTNMRIFRVIKVVRLLRVVRIARVIRYVSALRMLIYSMVVSLKSVFWALLLFLIIIYVCAIVFTQEVAQSMLDDGVVDAGDPRLEFWGSIFSSMFTLYKSICGGVDWHTVVLPLQEIHLGLACLFAFFIWFMCFVALNVITGVFCSTALSAAANDPEIIAMGLQVSKATRHAHAKKLFRAIDTDDSGEVTIGELATRLDVPEVQGLLLAIGVDTNDAVALFGVLDAKKSGTIDCTEFVEGCISLRGAVSNLDFVRASSETRLMMESLAEIMAALEVCMDRAVPSALGVKKA